MAEEVSRLVQAIREGIESRLVDLHSAIPCQVQSFDATNQLVSVQPALKRKYSDGEVVNLPVITNVPIVYPRGADSMISFPIRKGDYVLCVFSERSIDFWLERGGVVDPQEARKFNLSDAIAIPGVYPRPNKSTRVSESALRIENKNGSIEVQPDGKFRIRNLEGEDLMDLLVQLLDALIATTTSTAIGPQAFLNLATYQQLKTKFEALKGE